MNNLFFIVGLARSRTTWLANFLTNEDSFCFHELMRSCSTLEELKQKLEAAATARGPGAVIGDADPSLNGDRLTDAIEQVFPQAKWVVVRRDADEAYESFQRAFPALNVPAGVFKDGERTLQLVGEALPPEQCLVVDYEGLEAPETCAAVHEFCLGRPMDRERWELLNTLRVTTIAEKAAPTLAPWARREILRQSQPLSAVEKEWEHLLRELCIGPTGPAAFEWLADLMAIALTWDHLADGDAINLLQADRAFEAVMLKWPFNAFWKNHGIMLAPVLSNAVAAWRHGSRGRHFDCYSEPALAVAYALGGTEHVARYAARVHELVRRGRRENDERDTKTLAVPKDAQCTMCGKPVQKQTATKMLMEALVCPECDYTKEAA